VTLDDWFHRDGRIVLAQRLLNEAKGAMQATLKDARFSPAILETHHPQDVLNQLFSPDSDKKLRARFQKACNHFDVASRCLSSTPSDKMCLDAAREAPKLREGLISELVHNRLNGYYFLSAVEPNGCDLGHVVLVREIQAIPREAALAIADGLDHQLFESMCQTSPSLRDKLTIHSDGFALPVGQLLSPHLEHLLQLFAFLFGRIGLPDPDASYVDGLWARQPTVISTK
jgi:hypothetical protein